MVFSTLFFVATVAGMAGVEGAHGASFGAFAAFLFGADDAETAAERRLARDESITDYLKFGVWDSHGAITPLQLQVAVSMALGVRASDDDIRVVGDEESFFEVQVEHATAEECDYVASPAFMAKLNVHLVHYAGSGVLSRPPRLHKHDAAAAAAAA